MMLLSKGHALKYNKVLWLLLDMTLKLKLHILYAAHFPNSQDQPLLFPKSLIPSAS